MNDIRWFTIINPASGGGRTRERWPRIASLLTDAGIRFTEAFTERAGDATAFARQAMADGFTHVISIGGDGTHNEVVNGILQARANGAPQATLGLIPCGTGGDLVKTLDLRVPPEEAVRRLRDGSDRACDAGHLHCVDAAGLPLEKYFINIASFGIGGEVDARVNRMSKTMGGFASFLIASLTAMLTYTCHQVRVVLDGNEISTAPLFLGAVANGEYFGGGMHAAPMAHIDDGLFDVIIIRKLFRPVLLAGLPTIYFGKHLLLPGVTHHRGRHIEASSSDDVLIDMDGEQPGKLPATFELLPGALRMRG